jgi:hypothetical protein
MTRPVIYDMALENGGKLLQSHGLPRFSFSCLSVTGTAILSLFATIGVGNRSGFSVIYEPESLPVGEKRRKGE